MPLPVLIIVAILPVIAITVGGLVALRFQHRLHPLMAFAAGVVVATALADLMPEAGELLGESAGRLPLAAAVMFGFLAFSALDAILHAQNWERSVSVRPEGVDSPASRWGLAPSAGIILHTCLDGVAIGLGFSANVQLGVAVTGAVLLHNFADGMNVVTLAMAAGQSRASARVVLALDAIAPAVGVALGSWIPLPPEALGALLGVFAGFFLAIGAGHLLPEAQHRQPGVAPSLVLAAALGAVLVLAVQGVLG